MLFVFTVYLIFRPRLMLRLSLYYLGMWMTGSRNRELRVELRYTLSATHHTHSRKVHPPNWTYATSLELHATSRIHNSAHFRSIPIHSSLVWCVSRTSFWEFGPLQTCLWLSLSVHGTEISGHIRQTQHLLLSLGVEGLEQNYPIIISFLDPRSCG